MANPKSVVTTSPNVNTPNTDLENLKAKLHAAAILRAEAESTAKAAKIASKVAKEALATINAQIEKESSADMALYFAEVSRLKAAANVALGELKAFATPEEFKAFRLSISPRKPRVASGKPRAARGSLKALKAATAKS